MSKTMSSYSADPKECWKKFPLLKKLLIKWHSAESWLIKINTVKNSIIN